MFIYLLCGMYKTEYFYLMSSAYVMQGFSKFSLHLFLDQKPWGRKFACCSQCCVYNPAL